MTPSDIEQLRQSLGPAPQGLHRTLIAYDNGVWRIWDSTGINGYLCSTRNVGLLIEILKLEAQSPWATRRLLHDEPPPINQGLPPTPNQDTYR